MINVSNHRWFVCQASFTLCGHIEKESFIKITAKKDTPIEFVPVRWRNTHLHFRAALQLSFTALPKSLDFFCRSAQRFWWTKSSWVKLRKKERNKQKGLKVDGETEIYWITFFPLSAQLLPIWLLRQWRKSSAFLGRRVSRTSSFSWSRRIGILTDDRRR